MGKHSCIFGQRLVAKSKYAQRWSKILTLNKVHNGVLVTVDGHGQPNKTECTLLRMYFYAPGIHYGYYFDFKICFDPIILNDTSTYQTMGRSDANKQVKILPKHMTKDEFIYMTTGFKVEENVWLKIAQLAALRIKGDCIVCTGARVSLHPVNALPNDNSSCALAQASTYNQTIIPTDCQQFHIALPRLKN